MYLKKIEMSTVHLKSIAAGVWLEYNTLFFLKVYEINQTSLQRL